MSILIFLLFSSLVYLAQADPVASNLKTEQASLDKFAAVVEKAYDEYITPILALGKEDCEYCKLTTLEEIKGIVNYCIFLARSPPFDRMHPFDDQDLIMEFDAKSSPFPLIHPNLPPK